MAYAYKAVKLTDKPGVYRSLYSVHPVFYKIGKKTTAPKGTGLICYRPGLDSYPEASDAPNTRLLRVKANGRVRLPLSRLEHESRATLKKLRGLWSGEDMGDWCWATGTIAYAEVTPLYLVDPYTSKRL